RTQRKSSIHLSRTGAVRPLRLRATGVDGPGGSRCSRARARLAPDPHRAVRLVRPRVVVGSSLAVAAALTAGWIAGTASTTATGSPSGKLTNGTYQGAVEQTRYGPVQVEITVAGGK